jgi:hypothetical protein
MKTFGHSRLSTAIFMILLVLLLYSLYIVLGGDTSFVGNLRSASGSGNLLEPITNSLRALGQSLTNVFTNLLP